MAKSAITFNQGLYSNMNFKYTVSRILMAFAVFFICLGGARAEAPTIAVVYPDVRDPYLSVFVEITKGIEAEIKRPVKHFPVGSEDTAASLIERMKDEKIDVVINLGRAGLLLAKPLSAVFPVVIGAVLVSFSPETQGLTGISLTPDPEVLFDKLKELVPKIKEINVVYDPKQKAWEIERARKACETRKLIFNALPAEDLRLSAKHYRDVLMEVRDNAVSIWLQQDNVTMDEHALLPMVLKEAWDKNFVVFSSNPDNVRKGALFSLYPDNHGMGRSLAIMASNRMRNSQQTTNIEPLRDLLIAVNLRTAEHLGLNLNGEGRHKFDLTFPSQQ